MLYALYKPGEKNIFDTVFLSGDGRYKTSIKRNIIDKYIQQGYILTTFDLACEMAMEAANSHYCKPWVQIHACDWDDAMGALPPMDFKAIGKHTFFKMQEMTCGNITTFYARVFTKTPTSDPFCAYHYFCANRPVNTDYETCLEEIVNECGLVTPVMAARAK